MKANRCKHCGVNYTTTSGRSKFCGGPCRQANHRLQLKFKEFGFVLKMTARSDDELNMYLTRYGYHGNEDKFHIQNKHKFYSNMPMYLIFIMKSHVI